MLALTVCVLVVFTGVVCGQSKYCCTFTKFEGNMRIFGMINAGGTPEMMSGNVGLSWNFEKKVVALTEVLQVGPTPVIMKIINDWEKKISYQIRNDTCVKAELLTPIPSNCIPDNATETGKFYLGSQESPLPAFSYFVSASGFGVSVTVTQGQVCTLIEETIYGINQGVYLAESVEFEGVTEGIRNSSVFIPPKSCDAVPEIKLNPHGRHVLERRHHFFGF